MTMTAEAPAIPPVKCAPWCVDGTGHPDADHPDDRYCHTDSHRVFLSAESPVEYDKGDWRLGDVAVYALREADNSRPTVQVSHNGMSTMALTGAEARELGNALLILGGAIEAQA